MKVKKIDLEDKGYLSGKKFINGRRFIPMGSVMALLY